MTKRLRIKIFGQVHGVFFRENARQFAIKNDILGTVENCPDGSVEINAEGNQDELSKLLTWAQTGPKFAKVEKVESAWQKPTGKFRDFQVE